MERYGGIGRGQRGGRDPMEDSLNSGYGYAASLGNRVGYFVLGTSGLERGQENGSRRFTIKFSATDG